MTLVIESNDEFVKRHGADAVQIDKGANLLFSDGAMMDGTFGQTRSEPPKDEHKLLKRQQLYWRTKLERDRKAFLSLRAALHEQATMAIKYSNARPPQSADVENLKRLRDAVQNHRAELAIVESALAATEPERQEQARAERMAERAMEIQKIADSINQVTLDGE